MPLEQKPLFRPDVLRKQLAYFNLPAAAKALRPELAKWKGLIESKQIKAVDKGNKDLSIDGYNGGLFEPDEILDRLTVPDEVCGYFRDLAGYDYRHAHEVAADAAAPGTTMVFGTGGFNVVVGNPPYVRQELLSPTKRYLETAYT